VQENISFWEGAQKTKTKSPVASASCTVRDLSKQSARWRIRESSSNLYRHQPCRLVPTDSLTRFPPLRCWRSRIFQSRFSRPSLVIFLTDYSRSWTLPSVLCVLTQLSINVIISRICSASLTKMYPVNQLFSGLSIYFSNFIFKNTKNNEKKAQWVG